jgi:hypothetical protein
VIRARNQRLTVPAVTAVLGSGIAVGAWIGSGWGAALGVELITVLGASAYFVVGGRDSDLGALMGSRPDERQVGIGMRSAALAGIVLVLVAIAGVAITAATKGTEWPFLLFSVVGGTSYLVGLVVYRGR